MQLVLEVCDTGGREPSLRKVFDGVGGVVGRGAGCDWVIPDPSRLLSNHHGLVSHRDQRYFLTDISSNGIRFAGSGKPLQKGQAHLIVEGDAFQLGPFALRARLVERVAERAPLQVPVPCAERAVIPDDAYLGLDPLHALDRQALQQASSAELDALTSPTDVCATWAQRGSVAQEHLAIPTLAIPPPAVEPVRPRVSAAHVDETFWAQFAQALGICLDTLDTAGREALAINAARALRHAISGLQQSLRTHQELKHELNLGGTGPPRKNPNPLHESVDVEAALAALLGTAESAQPSAEVAIAQVCRELQVHQVALLVASRTMARTAQAAFAPGHLLRCFERDATPSRFFADGAHWRAYQRHYQRLVDEQALSAQAVHPDFINAYEEQVRLAGALFAGYSG
ncbi:type VI secretion protein [Pseudomonas marginalis ICMP 9505]|nr:type VI secretion protein [Pseudomonas marginalis ICMP 9505]